MESETLYLFAADLILAAHVAFVAFVVVSVPLVLVGKMRSWPWVRNPWFRWAHLLAIGVVVLQSWLGVVCPLTVWEMSLRAQAGDTVYRGTFVSHWLEQVLYYQAPAWVFVSGYTAFAILVVICWYWVRPGTFRPASLQGSACAEGAGGSAAAGKRYPTSR